MRYRTRCPGPCVGPPCAGRSGLTGGSNGDSSSGGMTVGDRPRPSGMPRPPGGGFVFDVFFCAGRLVDAADLAPGSAPGARIFSQVIMDQQPDVALGHRQINRVCGPRPAANQTKVGAGDKQ